MTNDDVRTTTEAADLTERVALGAMLFGTRLDEATSFELLDAYVDGGGVWIDTADCYAFWEDPSGFGGQSEQLLGRWLAKRPGMRDRVRIATKVGCEPTVKGGFPEYIEGLAPAVVRRVFEQSCRRLGVDHIDLYWTHEDDRAVPLAETVAAFGELVAAGGVGTWGHSNVALWRTERARGLAAAAGTAPPTAVQLRYSYLQPRPMVRAHDHDHRFGWVTDEVLDFAASTPGTRVWAYSPLMGGAYDRPDREIPAAFDHPGTTARLAVLAEVAQELGVTRSEVVTAWLAGGEPTVAPILGVSALSQLQAGLAGARTTLPADVRERLDAAW